MTKNRILFRGQPLKLDDSLLLGQGGEARVFRHPSLDLALKVFHDIDPALPLAERAQQERLAQLRREKLAAFPTTLPSSVVGPVELLHDAQQQIAGYAMAKVTDAVDVATLAQKRSRAIFPAASIVTVFRAIRHALEGIHKSGVVVGDLNDGNIVLSNMAPFFIDADSMQLGQRLPCAVAHERFLDPRFYGRSLLDDGCLDEASDLYALRVLLFQSLVCMHPFGGVHATLPTLLRRAEASHSVLRGDVQIPRAAIPFSTLPDDLLEDFARCFDRGERMPFPERLLDMRFELCSCGVEHARTSCPVCKTQVQAPAIRTSGGAVEETIVETRGVVLLARYAGGHLQFLVEEDGRVRREDHSTVLAGTRVQGMRFEIAGDATWVGHGTELVKVRGEQVVDRARTSLVRGTPAFAAGRGGLWIVEGDVLVHHDSRARAGRVLEEQTALFSSDSGGLGVYRAGLMLMGFVFREGTFSDAELPQPNGKLVDLDVIFDEKDGSALVGMACEKDGKRTHTQALLDPRGKLVAVVSGAPDALPILESIRGKCIYGGRIVSASSEGVCAVVVDAKSKRLTTGSIFADTRPFVDATVELLPGAGGTLVVVSPQAITRLRLRGANTGGQP